MPNTPKFIDTLSGDEIVQLRMALFGRVSVINQIYTTNLKVRDQHLASLRSLIQAFGFKPELFFLADQNKA